jgi:hypothetical protein
MRHVLEELVVHNDKDRSIGRRVVTSRNISRSSIP